MDEQNDLTLEENTAPAGETPAEDPNPFHRAPGGAVPPRSGGAAPQKRRFFADTWQIFKRMFSSKSSGILAIAAEDNHPVWRSNLIVCLAADLIALALMLFRWLARLPVYPVDSRFGFGGGAQLLLGGIVGGLACCAASAFLLIAAMKVLLYVVGRNIAFTRVANVTTACLLPGAAFTLGGSVLALIAPVFLFLGVGIGGAAGALLLYTGIRKFLEPDREPVWPYIWTCLLYQAAAVLSSAVLLLLFLGSAFLGNFSWF